jgi:hypothetical protein
MGILSTACETFLPDAIPSPISILERISVVCAWRFFPWPVILKQYDIHNSSCNIYSVLRKRCKSKFQTVYKKQTIYGTVYTANSVYDVTRWTRRICKILKQFIWGLHSSGICSTLDVRCLIFWDHAVASSTVRCPVKTLEIRILKTTPLLGLKMGSNKYQRTDKNIPDKLKSQG